MMRRPIDSRGRFILLVTAAYAVASLAWIFLSDRVLSTVADFESMVWLSSAKGIFFVAVSAAAFFLALRAVPPAGEAGPPHVLDALAEGISPGRVPTWLGYAFAVLVSLAMVAARGQIAPLFDGRPLLILFMFPIIVSALLGGLGPGLAATAVSAAGLSYVALPPIGSIAIASRIDLLQWGFLIANGIAVSLLSEALRRSLKRSQLDRRLLDAVISGTSDAIYVKDAAGRYVLINEAAAAFVSKPQSEIIGHDDRWIFPEPSAGKLMARDRAIMAGGRTQTHEESVRLFDGRDMVFLVTKGPVFDAEGHTVGLFGISRDITGRKEAEDESRRLNVALERRVGERTAELQALNGELEELAYALTHNLRAPLRAIGGFTRLLGEELAERLDAEAAAHLEQITVANAGMATMIDGILVYLRCMSKPLDWQTVDVSALASTRLGELSRRDPQRAMNGVVEPGLSVRGDAALLGMAVNHLIENAWKFTRDRTGAEIRVYAAEVEGQPGICVADNGAGFDMAHAERLFRPFQRLHRADEFPGNGIGLAMVRRIIAKHGGRLRAHGMPDAGASFCFSLPAGASHGDRV